MNRKKKQGPEYWVKNRTPNDILCNELGLKIPANQVVNLGKLNPKLTDDQLQASEENGFLSRAYFAQKLIKVPFAPQMQAQAGLSLATEPIETRVSTSVMVDSKQKDFIEELTHFDEEVAGGRFSDGFLDPTAESDEIMVPQEEIPPEPITPTVVESNSGERYGNYAKPFSIITVEPKKGKPAETTPHTAKAKIKQVGKTLVLDVEET